MEEKIIEKIKKLLALGKSSNKHEAELSMLKAQELLAKHKLSLKTVKESELAKSIIKEKICNVSFTTAKWKIRIAMIFGENFSCYVYTTGRHPRFITFLGKEEDAEICSITFQYAIECVNNMVKKLRYQRRKYGQSTRGIENDYAIGFSVGLEQKFEKQKRANEEWGLVLVKDKEVIDAYQNTNFAKKIVVNSTLQGNTQAIAKGYEDGSNFNMQRRLGVL